jgi:hypothetical protein
MPSWNRGHIVGQKPPLKPREVWSIRTRLQVSGAERDLALFNLAIDSKLRGCDLVTITVGDVALSGSVRDRTVEAVRPEMAPNTTLAKHSGDDGSWRNPPVREAVEMTDALERPMVCSFTSSRLPSGAGRQRIVHLFSVSGAILLASGNGKPRRDSLSSAKGDLHG